MTPICPKCHRAIPEADINVANDVALCRACTAAYKLSQLVRSVDLGQVDVTRPPRGAWYQSTGLGANIGATHRSIGGAIGTLAIALFWNGITSVFVLLALSSTLHLLHIPVPEWFPAPRMNNSTMGTGITIFLWLFLTPFILIGAGMIAAFLSAIAGRTEVTTRHMEGLVRSGVGPLSIRRRFNTEAVKDVRIEEKNWRDSDGDRQRKTQVVIELEDGKLINFGTSLTPERMRFVAAATRNVVLTKS